MGELFTSLASNAAALGILGAAVTFIWSVVQFVLVRRRDERHREFEIYHRLVKELVSLDPDSKVVWIDRQCAVLFELRGFERYHELTLRTLGGLKSKWSSQKPEDTFPRLLEEVDLTIEFIRARER